MIGALHSQGGGNGIHVQAKDLSEEKQRGGGKEKRKILGLISDKVPMIKSQVKEGAEC